MTPKQKKINEARQRRRDRAKQVLDPEVYDKVMRVGQAKYDTDEEFVQAVINLERWVEKREKEKKAS